MFLGGVLLAFGAMQFFVVQKCPTYCKVFNVPGPCWLNARRFPSLCKNPSPRFKCPYLVGGTPSPEFHCLLQFENTKEKAPAPKHCLCCLVFPWALGTVSASVKLYLPVLQDRGCQAASPVLVVIVT